MWYVKWATMRKSSSGNGYSEDEDTKNPKKKRKSEKGEEKINHKGSSPYRFLF
jgi:hypothetical protein